MIDQRSLFKNGASREFPEKGQPHILVDHDSASPADQAGEVAFNLPGVFKKFHSKPSTVKLFIKWVKLADETNNGIIPIPLKGWGYNRTTVWRRINWLMRHHLMVRIESGKGSGNASRYRIRWTFKFGGTKRPLKMRQGWYNSDEKAIMVNTSVAHAVKRDEVIRQFLDRMKDSNHAQVYNPRVILKNLTSRAGSPNRSRAYANLPEKRKQPPQSKGNVKTCRARHKSVSSKPKHQSKLYKHRWEGAKRYALAKIREAEKTSINIEKDAWKVIRTAVSVHLPRLLESRQITVGRQVNALIRKTVEELNHESQVMPQKFQNFENELLLPEVVGEAKERKFKKIWRRNLFTDISKILIQNALLISGNAQAERISLRA